MFKGVYHETSIPCIFQWFDNVDGICLANLPVLVAGRTILHPSRSASICPLGEVFEVFDILICGWCFGPPLFLEVEMIWNQIWEEKTAVRIISCEKHHSPSWYPSHFTDPYGLPTKNHQWHTHTYKKNWVSTLRIRDLKTGAWEIQKASLRKEESTPIHWRVRAKSWASDPFITGLINSHRYGYNPSYPFTRPFIRVVQ